MGGTLNLDGGTQLSTGHNYVAICYGKFVYFFYCDVVMTFLGYSKAFAVVWISGLFYSIDSNNSWILRVTDLDISFVGSEAKIVYLWVACVAVVCYLNWSIVISVTIWIGRSW